MDPIAADSVHRTQCGERNAIALGDFRQGVAPGDDVAPLCEQGAGGRMHFKVPGNAFRNRTRNGATLGRVHQATLVAGVGNEPGLHQDGRDVGRLEGP